MRAVKRTSAFKRDYKREKKGKHCNTLDDALRETLVYLLRDQALPLKYYDHVMRGIWHDCRNCHVKPDLVMLYRKPDADALHMVRLGSHAELGI
jgi:mRNA interferase YafQ